MSARLTRIVHRVHRLFGSALGLLLLVWFVSGAVMTCADFPGWSEAERLASAQALPRGAKLALAPTLSGWLQAGALARGERPRLAMIEGRPTWVLPDEQGVRQAFLNQPPWRVGELDAQRAGVEASARTGKRVRSIERVSEPDQWTVGLARPGALPFYRVFLADDASATRAERSATRSARRGQQVYLSARTGEIVQESTRGERALAWLGAIPHWIYPTLLRRDRVLWRSTVLTLSALGLVLSLSGLFAGTALASLRRRKRIVRAVRDPVLRWHQRLGLGFGALASSWLFSGALSLSPFHWTGDRGPSESEIEALYGVRFEPEALPLSQALARCQSELTVKELELASLHGRVYAVCYAGAAQTRVVDLTASSLTPRRTVERASMRELVHAFGPAPARLSEHTVQDAYYYPTHRAPRIASPYLKLQLGDADETSLYLDPARVEVLLRYTRAGRLERWLYHGLHSLDVPGLVEHRALWRTLVLLLMAVGACLCALGLAMSVRKILRRHRRLRQRRA